jgi:catechol 2,3-dioxygenase-like lactoylglutathione lyase family enzyme
MQQRLSLITLGITDLARSRAFYEQAMGWTPQFVSDDIAMYQLNGFVLGLFGRTALLEDARVDAEAARHAGPGAMSLAYNVDSADEVDRVLGEMASAGARILKPGEQVEWGGYSGYFADPDGHLWEVAWNPNWTIEPDGSTRMGDQ